MKLSIVIPVYNSQKYIDRCLKSIITNVKNSDFEVILVDDGSEDDSYDICKKYADVYANIDVYRYKNSGVSYARNRGIEKAQGEFIWFVDSDDCVVEGFLDYLFDVVLLEDSDVVMFRYLSEEKNKITPSPLFEREINAIELLKDFYLTKIDAAVWQFIFKKKILQSERFDEGVHYSEDALFLTRLFVSELKFICIDEIGYRYIHNSESAVTKSISSKKMTTFDAIDKIERVIGHNAELLEFFYIYKITMYYYLTIEMEKKSYKSIEHSIGDNKMWMAKNKRYFYVLPKTQKEKILFSLAISPFSFIFAINNQFRRMQCK